MHRVVVALDARQVHKPRGATGDHTARKGRVRDRLIAALGHCARAVSNPFAPFQHFGNTRMMLEALELIVGRQIRVLIIQIDDVSDINLIVINVIQERPAPLLEPKRPAK